MGARTDVSRARIRGDRPSSLGVGSDVSQVGVLKKGGMLEWGFLALEIHSATACQRNVDVQPA